MASNPTTDEACQVLIINVDENNPDFWSQMNPDLEKYITEKYKTKNATTSPAAIDILTGSPRNIPPVVLIVAAGIFRTGHASTHFRLHQLLSSHAKNNGGTVVFCGNVPSSIQMDEISVIFSKAYDLPWDRAPYTGGDFKRNENMRSAFGDALFETLPKKYSTKALLFGGISKESRLYTYEGDCEVAFHKHGKGRIGYIGDVNNEDGSVAALKAMIEAGINSSEFNPNALNVPAATNEDSCRVCLRPSKPEHKCPKCKGSAFYCSKACQIYDWPDHKSSCTQPAWKDPSTNLFVRLFPRLAMESGLNDENNNNNYEDAIVRLIDAFRAWHKANNSRTELLDYDREEASQEIIEEFEEFLVKARIANAVPIWWDVDAVAATVDYATFGEKLGKIKSSVYIGERIQYPEHIDEQYGGDQAEYANVVELAINIGGTQLPSGKVEHRF